MFSSKFRATTALLAGLLAAGSAQAVTFNFLDISNQPAGANAADQISVDVITGAAGTVRFNFTFGAGQQGNITEIGFGGASSNFLTGAATEFNGAGVNFADENNFTGGFSFNQVYGVARTNGNGLNGAAAGIAVGETLGVQYSLAAGKTLLDVTNAIQAGSFNIGLHVQGLTPFPGVSDSQKAIISTIPTPGPGTTVPDGGTSILLLGAALAGLAAFRRTRS